MRAENTLLGADTVYSLLYPVTRLPRPSSPASPGPGGPHTLGRGALRKTVAVAQSTGLPLVRARRVGVPHIRAKGHPIQQVATPHLGSRDVL